MSFQPLPDDLLNTRLSQVLGSLGSTGQLLHLASKLVPGKQPKTMLNLMAMATGAASTTKDPMGMIQMVQGPMSDLATMSMEDKNKRMSEVMPATGMPTGSTAPAVAPELPQADQQQILDRFDRRFHGGQPGPILRDIPGGTLREDLRRKYSPYFTG